MIPNPNSRPGVRIGDAERDRAVSVLTEHFVAGRLTQQEHDERTSAVWAARTQADLTPLFRDLPELPQPVVAGQGRSRRRFDPPLWPFVMAMFVVMIVTGAPWWVWPIAIVLWVTGALARLVRRAGRRLESMVGRSAHSSGSRRPDRGSWS